MLWVGSIKLSAEVLRALLTHCVLNQDCSEIMENKFKVQTAGIVMASVLWDNESILLLEFLKRSSIINSQQKVQTLKKLKQ
jgi:hypothetical protein